LLTHNSSTEINYSKATAHVSPLTLMHSATDMAILCEYTTHITK